MIIEVSVAVIALAFVILTIYLIIMSKAIDRTLDEVNRTLVETRIQMRELSQNSGKTMEKVDTINMDLKHKMEALDPIFNAITNIGKIFEHQSASLKHRFLRQNLNEYRMEEEEAMEDEKPSTLISEAIEIASSGIRLWQKLKKKGGSHE